MFLKILLRYNPICLLPRFCRLLRTTVILPVTLKICIKEKLIISLYDCFFVELGQTNVGFKVVLNLNSNIKTPYRLPLERLLLKTGPINSNIVLILIGCDQMFAGYLCSKETAQTASPLVSWRQDWLSPLCSCWSFLPFPPPPLARFFFFLPPPRHSLSFYFCKCR